jgi:hypothetical protein
MSHFWATVTRHLRHDFFAARHDLDKISILNVEAASIDSVKFQNSGGTAPERRVPMRSCKGSLLSTPPSIQPLH